VFQGYRPRTAYDEMFAPDGQVRPPYRQFFAAVNRLTAGQWDERRARADRTFLESGVTFAVYADAAGSERIFPFDLVPRIVAAEEWRTIEAGLRQRVTALNRFLHDVYHEQDIVEAGVIPGDLVIGAPDFRTAMVGFEPPLGVYTHLVGCDLVRDGRGNYVVLEDNARTPSGVSYVLENRRVMARVLPEVFSAQSIAPITDYTTRLLALLRSLLPERAPEGQVVVLTPGPYNSAYYEHSFLAQQMGVPLVQGSDLLVHDEIVYMNTTAGLERVGVIYRRIDDDYLDPLTFRPESHLGVAGLMDAYLSGQVAIANAVGTGVADDKAIYAFVPEMIRFYLGETPILENVPTYVGALPVDRERILDCLPQLVVKPTNASGGTGLVIGPQASPADLDALRRRILADPRGYIAQPLLDFSTVPAHANGAMQPRHTDLRPYVLAGREVWVLPGGLSRVALEDGSFVVNSSRGGGSKDTWVLEE
jgi:uncharacterized circularly permuted ATP-grasp superfamily protein